MLNYDTGIVSQPPITPAMRQQALAGLTAYGKQSHPTPFADIYDGRAQRAAVNMERAAEQANNEHLLKAQEAQAQLAMQGAQLMQTGQQNALNLDNSRRGDALNYAAQLLGGVNGILRGLYS